MGRGGKPQALCPNLAPLFHGRRTTKSGKRQSKTPWPMDASSADPERGCQLLCSEAGLFIPMRAYPPRGGPIHPEASLSTPRRAYPVPVLRRASVPRRASLYGKARLGIDRPASGLMAGLSAPTGGTARAGMGSLALAAGGAEYPPPEVAVVLLTWARSQDQEASCGNAVGVDGLLAKRKLE